MARTTQSVLVAVLVTVALIVGGSILATSSVAAGDHADDPPATLQTSTSGDGVNNSDDAWVKEVDEGGRVAGDAVLIVICYDSEEAIYWSSDEQRIRGIPPMLQVEIFDVIDKKIHELGGNESKYTPIPPGLNWKPAFTLPVFVDDNKLFLINVIPCDQGADDSNDGDESQDDEDDEDDGESSVTPEDIAEPHEYGHALVDSYLWKALECLDESPNGPDLDWPNAGTEGLFEEFEDLADDAHDRYHDKVGKDSEEAEKKDVEGWVDHIYAAEEAVEETLEDAYPDFDWEDCFDKYPIFMEFRDTNGNGEREAANSLDDPYGGVERAQLNGSYSGAIQLSDDRLLSVLEGSHSGRPADLTDRLIDESTSLDSTTLELLFQLREVPPEQIPDSASWVVGGERINVYVGNDTLVVITNDDGQIERIATGELENPTMRVEMSTATAREISKADDTTAAIWTAVDQGEISYRGVGVINSIRIEFVKISIAIRSLVVDLLNGLP